MAIDEVLEGRFVTGPGDAVEVDLAGPLFARRFDRRGFTVAGDSSRRPEPERDRPTGNGGPIELSAADEWRGEPQRLGHRRIERGLRRCGDARVRVVRSHAINVVAMTPRRNHWTTTRRLVGSRVIAGASPVDHASGPAPRCARCDRRTSCQVGGTLRSREATGRTGPGRRPVGCRTGSVKPTRRDPGLAGVPR